MDGKRDIRAQGTDGSDFSHRQQVANRYSALASAKSFIHTASLITSGVIALTCIFSAIDPLSTGTELSIFSQVGLVVLGVATALSGLKLSQNVNIALVHIYSLLSFLHIGVTSLLLLFQLSLLILSKDFAHVLLYILCLAYFFNLLVNYRAYEATQEILVNIDAQSAAPKQKHALRAQVESTKKNLANNATSNIVSPKSNASSKRRID